MMRLARLGPVAALCLIGLGLLSTGVMLHAPLAAQPAGEGLKAAPAPRADSKPLWAGLSINRPVFQEGRTGDRQITFTLVNDGDKVIDPKVASSKLSVNGKPLADSAFILGNGPRDDRFEALPAGDHLVFAYALGSYFDRPGVYRVCWEGKSFRSADLVFRVLPKPVKSAKQEAPAQAAVEPGKKIEGIVDRIVNTADGEALVLKSGVRVGIDDKTEYLAETGLDAMPITWKDVLGKAV